MKHNYFHYCISVQLGKGGEERKVPKREIKRDGRTEGKEDQERYERGEHMNGKKDRKAFYARKSTQRKLTELAKNVQPFRNSEACLLGLQTSSGCISINLYSADKKANFNIHWICSSYLSLPPTQCRYLSPLARAGVTEGLNTPPHTRIHAVLNIFLHKHNFYTIYRNSVRLMFF